MSPTKSPLNSSTNVPFFDILYENIDKFSKNQNLTETLKNQGKGFYKALPNFIPKLNGESKILDQQKIFKILKYIPPLYRLRDLNLVYSNLKHGTCMATLLLNCENIGPNILIIKDHNDNIFGAFCTENWHMSLQFYGTGESFLFKYFQKENKDKIKVYAWSGKKQEIQYVSSEGIAVGIGDSYGLFIKEDLFTGQSGQSETFDNEVLSGNKNFKIKDIEIWAFDCY